MKSPPPDYSTLRRLAGGLLGPSAGEAAISLEQLPSGASGMPVFRCRIEMTPSATCVIKKTERRERMVLALLTHQNQLGAPRAFVLDSLADEIDWVSLEDAGDLCRPSSLDPITEAEFRAEALALASIHVANREEDDAEKLAWLPRLDQKWVEEVVLAHFFWPAWERARRDAGGVGTLLEPYAPSVESLAADLTSAMGPLFEDRESTTLVHADINPSNVLIRPDGRGPCIIDWQTARVGPLYTDVPHHFCTRAQAEGYRLALAELGFEIAEGIFDERYRLASRLIGFRYIWWTLSAWQGSEADTDWVHHYLRRILHSDAGE